MSAFLIRRLLTRAFSKSFEVLYQRRLKRFEESLKDPGKAQSTALSKILKGASQTKYGRELGVFPGMSPEEFRNRVPIVDYDAIETWVMQQSETLDPVLTPNRVLTFEKTSGSRGPSKWIPYNKAHLKTFERMFILWSLDLLRSGLKLETGRFFFLISPKTGSREFASNGIPVGLQDDSEYLGGFTKRLSQYFFVDSSHLQTSEDYIRDLAICLLNETDLEVISVWSPSLLVLALELISSESQALLNSSSLSPQAISHLSRSSSPCDWWPRLKIISCWDSATSSHDAQALRRLFPETRVQGKGLLATEVAMTIPWCTGNANVPLIEDIYFEFIDERTGAIHSLEELSLGETYEIVTTAPNGFLRYRMGDRVRVSGTVDATPSLEFIGRKDSIIDLAGEKISSGFISRVFSKLAAEGFSLLLPRSGSKKGYVLLTSAAEAPSIGLRLEGELSHQHHYALARKMGQLEPLQTLSVPDLRALYYHVISTSGVPMGQIKTAQLVTDHHLAAKILSAIQPSQEAGSRNADLLLPPSIL